MSDFERKNAYSNDNGADENLFSSKDSQESEVVTNKVAMHKPWSSAIGADLDDDVESSNAQLKQDNFNTLNTSDEDVDSYQVDDEYDEDDNKGNRAQDYVKEDNYNSSYQASDDEFNTPQMHEENDDFLNDEEYEDNEADEDEEADGFISTQSDENIPHIVDAADDEDAELVRFDSLNLSKEVLKAIELAGFEQPTPIQVRAIPSVLAGKDMIGQAQTGTGKTAAFALPILSLMPKKQTQIYALVLEPTRELAIQVSESFSRFAHFIKDFRVAPIYGGASYDSQLRSLKHGAQVVVATPGRLIDLIERGKLDFSSVKHVVIDEADEMLRMGFIDDVDWILEKIPHEHQTALFSATMPPAIRRIAREHLVNPEEIRIEAKTTTATTVRQRYWVVSGVHKIDAMCRMLEVEPYEAVLVFVRTKTDAEDVANKLAARGLACAALHGDIPQRQREKVIERLKKGLVDIIIATDVAARGLDVDRVTHVFNYDIPYDAESYVHRIGRTGRAGRNGEAILFVSPRERRALRHIERITRQRIEPMRMPTIADVNKRRLENFRNQIIETIDAGGLEDYIAVISDILSNDSIEIEMLAAALAKMAQRDGSLLLDESIPEPKHRSFDDFSERHDRRNSRRGGPSAEPVPLREFPDIKMVRYRIAVGRRDAVKPGQIVGAIANEANIESKYIGEISIYDSFSTVDLPEGMPSETMRILAMARVCGRSLDLREYTLEPPRRRDFNSRFERDDDRHERNERGERSERGDYHSSDRRERFDRHRPHRSHRMHNRDNHFEDNVFDYMDEGEYRHEKGDINGNSIDYRPNRSLRHRMPFDRRRKSMPRPRPRF